MTVPLGRKGIETALQSIITKSIEAGVPGISAQITSALRGTLWTCTVGYVDLMTKESVETKHLFGIGSITKVFVTVVILQLAEEKRLRVDETVGQLLGQEIYHGIENASNATVEGLLSHTAGVDSWEEDPIWIVHGRGKELDLRKVWAKTETLSYVRRLNPSGPEPGKFSYSNTDFTLLGLIVEKITGRSAEDEIRRRILEPLGMKQTYLEGFEVPTDSNISPHRYHWNTPVFRARAGICPSFTEPRDDLIDATGSNLSVEWTAGGLVTSPSDLTLFAIALRDGSLLSPSSLKFMKEWHPATQSMEFGHGLFRLQGPVGAGKWLGHSGDVLGFTSALFWKEDADCVVCVLANVGTVHTGNAPSSASDLIENSAFLKLAGELAACTD